MTAKRRPSVTDEFTQRCKYLKQLGVEYRQAEEWRPTEPPRSPHPLALFASVRLPLTPHEWVALVQNEGQFYIGGCCASASYIQDAIESVFRFHAGWIECTQLAEIADAMIAHDGTSDEPSFAALLIPIPEAVAIARKSLRLPSRKLGITAVDPWWLLKLIWHIVKDFYAPSRPQPSERPTDRRAQLDAAVSLLGRGLTAISWADLFGNGNVQREPQAHASRLVALARLLPALKMLNENVDLLDPGPIAGQALVLQADPDNVLSNGHGLCIFKTAEDAQKLIDLWKRQEAEHVLPNQKLQPAAKEYAVRPVRVSKEHGVEFL